MPDLRHVDPEFSAISPVKLQNLKVSCFGIAIAFTQEFGAAEELHNCD
jgi:hypothetical protein